MTAAAVQIEAGEQGTGQRGVDAQGRVNGQTGAARIAGIKIVTGCMFRVQRGGAIRFSSEPPPASRSKPEPVHRPARVAVMLSLAHALQDSVDQDEDLDQAEVARRLRLTRARVSQLFDLCLLAPDLQEAILELEAIDGIEPLSERMLRPIIAASNWTAQRALWAGITKRTAGYRSKAAPKGEQR